MQLIWHLLIRNLSPELQEDVLRVLANGNLLLKTAKQLMPGIAGLVSRTGLSQQQIAGLPAGLNSQVLNIQSFVQLLYIVFVITCFL